jgi:hypothetical protein
MEKEAKVFKYERPEFDGVKNGGVKAVDGGIKQVRILIVFDSEHSRLGATVVIGGCRAKEDLFLAWRRIHRALPRSASGNID